MKKTIVLVILSIILLTGCAGRGQYTVENVLERCNLAGCDEFSEDGNTFYYQRIENKDHTEIVIIDTNNAYHGYSFLIFKSEKAAEKKLEKRKESFFKEKDLEIGENYACGWEDGVMDASIKVFDYQSSNMIIEHWDENIGSDSFADDGWYGEYYSDSAIKMRAEEAKMIHERIMREW